MDVVRRLRTSSQVGIGKRQRGWRVTIGVMALTALRRAQKGRKTMRN
jgi:hypothetical protein